jgi:exopolyphosphatase / guanosine-5'-triphosphate,3'-diphosphate pyrophosphatase
VPGALVAEALMDIFELPTLAICPWALREGVILERIDRLGLVDGPEGI